MRNLLRWTRLDEGFLEAVLGAAALVVAVFGVLVPALGVLGVGPGGPTTRTVEIRERASLPNVPTGSGGVTLTGTREAELAFRAPGLEARLLLALPELVVAALALIVLLQLLRIARTVRDGDPFVRENARRLTVIALAVVAGAALVPLAFALTTDALARGTPAEPFVAFTVSMSTVPLLAGLLVAALAEVFRRGTKLRDDTAGLV